MNTDQFVLKQQIVRKALLRHLDYLEYRREKCKSQQAFEYWTTLITATAEAIAEVGLAKPPVKS